MKGVVGGKPLILEMGMWSPINLTAIYHSKVTDSITMPFLVSKQNYIITHIKVVGFKRIYISIVNLSTAFHYRKDMIYSPRSSFYLIYGNTSRVLKTIIIIRKSCQQLMWGRISTNRLNWGGLTSGCCLERKKCFLQVWFLYLYLYNHFYSILIWGRRILTCFKTVCSK